MSDPIAQGQNEVQQEVQQNEAAPPAPTQQAPNPHEGVQARFNELTARFHDERRRAEELESRYLETLRTIALQNQQPRQREPEVEFNDPEAAKAYQLSMQRMEQRMEQMQRQYEQQLGQVRFQTVIQQEQGLDPAIANRAAQLFQAWQGDPRRQGWTEQDAVIYAQGEAARQASRQGAANQQLQQFNRGAQVTPTYAPPPSVAPRSDSLPADFDDLDADKQIAILEKRLTGKVF